MDQLSAKSIRNAVVQQALAVFLLAFGGCQSFLLDQNRNVTADAVYESTAINAGYRETRWTSLESDSQWETVVEYEEDLPELESAEVPLNILDQASFDEPTAEASLDIEITSESTQRVDPESADLDLQAYSDSGIEMELEQVEIEYIR
ncbi:hypothetical protein SH528x_003712 [Novipirellula sp. SH528]|uniref:hypothetical protein n=1 Tax=Novipirellula sp. SH528 TaxID=3454466 RepID=UPI003F9F8910